MVENTDMDGFRLPEGYAPGKDGGPSDIARLIDTGIDVNHDHDIRSRIDSRIPWINYELGLRELGFRIEEKLYGDFNTDDLSEWVFSDAFRRFEPIYDEEKGDFEPVDETKVPVNEQLKQEYGLLLAGLAKYTELSKLTKTPTRVEKSTIESRIAQNTDAPVVFYVSKKNDIPGAVAGLREYAGLEILKLDSIIELYSALRKMSDFNDMSRFRDVYGIIIDGESSQPETVSRLSYNLLHNNGLQQKPGIVYAGWDAENLPESFTAGNIDDYTPEILVNALMTARQKAELYIQKEQNEAEYERLRLIAHQLGVPQEINGLMAQLQRELQVLREYPKIERQRAAAEQGLRELAPERDMLLNTARRLERYTNKRAD